MTTSLPTIDLELGRRLLDMYKDSYGQAVTADENSRTGFTPFGEWALDNVEAMLTRIEVLEKALKHMVTLADRLEWSGDWVDEARALTATDAEVKPRPIPETSSACP